MIYVLDNFLEKEELKSIQNMLNSNEYIEHKTPGKSFWVQEAEPSFIDNILNRLSNIEGQEIESILGFFRVSNEDVDTEWRIHSDLNINCQKPDRAIVLYISPKEIEDIHGTAFWEHKVYGKSLPKDTTDEEYDRMIMKESENLDMWRLSSVSGYEENRLISYPAHYFHSKYPNKSWKNGRQVFVMFYKTKTKNKPVSKGFNFRPLVEEDYDIICKWWKWWRWSVVPRESLPDNGKSGFMIEKNGVPIVSGFLFITNSSWAKLEFIVSNPEYKEKDRKQAVEMLITGIENICRDMGLKHIFSVARNEHLMNTHEKLGWTVDRKPSHELTKNL